MRTSSKTFNTYLESHNVEFDPDELLVQLNARVKGTQPYYEPSELNHMLEEYIKYKIDSNNLTTENGNNLQAMRVQNALYIDIDYYFHANVLDSEYEGICSDIAMCAKEYYEDEVKCNKVSFVFIPASFQNSKGGAHIMMFCEKNISIEERRAIYANVKEQMTTYILESHPNEIMTKEGGVLTEFNANNYEKVFDSSPLFSISTLLPFAQKDIKSRNYVLKLDISSECIVSGSYPFNLLRGRLYEDKTSSIASEIPMETHLVSLDDDIDGESDREEEDVVANPLEGVGGTVALFAEFVRSLIYLNENHILFKLLDDDLQRKRFVMAPIINMLAMCQIYDTETIPNKEKIISITTFIMHPLLCASVRNAPKEHKRTSIKSVEADVRGTFERMCRIDALFVKEDIERRNSKAPPQSLDESATSERASALKTSIEKNQLEIATISAKIKSVRTNYDAKFKDINKHIKAFQVAGDSGNVEALKAELEKCQNEKVNALAELNMKLTKAREQYKIAKHRLEEENGDVDVRKRNKIDDTLAKCIISCIKFVRDVIMAGITDELKPFRPAKELKNDIYAYCKHNREDVSKDELEKIDPRDPSSITYYEKILMIWARMFLFIIFIDKQSTEKAKTETISAFVRYFLYYSEHDILYIYNFRQTKLLEKYPYNQWIVDKPVMNGRTKQYPLIEDFIRKFNIDIIDKFLSTEYRINGYDLLRDLGLWCNERLKKNLYNDRIAPSASDRQSKVIVDNVIANAREHRKVCPVEFDATQGNKIGGVNGVCEFDQTTGEPTYSFNNIDSYCQSTSNVIFDEHYDKNNKWYALVESMYKTTFPIEEERVYMKRIVAAIFTGIKQDTISILYGTGAEGKSVYSNSIIAMLGSDSIGNRMKYDINKSDKYIINNNGLATAIQSKTILESARSGTADEGGIIHAKNKRFIMAQEPPMHGRNSKIQTSVLKEYTSGTSVNARGLYKSSETFVINAQMSIQTNIIPTFDEMTDAVKRRIRMIPMKAKFYTNYTENERKNLRYAVKADETVANYAKDDIYFAQAHFYYLLDDIKYVISNGFCATSDIPTPSTIEEATKMILNSTSGLPAWLTSHIVEHKKSVLPVAKIIEAVCEANSSLVGRREAGLFKNNTHLAAKYREIVEAINTQFSSKVFKLKDEYYEQVSKDRVNVPNHIFEDIESCAEEHGCDVIKEKYFDEYPISDINSSRRKNVSSGAYNDLFLVGAAFETE